MFSRKTVFVADFIDEFPVHSLFNILTSFKFSRKIRANKIKIIDVLEYFK